MLNITGNRYDTAFGYDSALAKPATLTDLWKLRGNWLFAGVGVGAMVLAGSYATVSYEHWYLWMPQTFILCLHNSCSYSFSCSVANEYPG